MLDKAVYLDAFHREVAAISVAAGAGLDAPVPSCPGWTMATLVTHLAYLYAGRAQLVRRRAHDNIARSYDDLGLPPEHKDWFGSQVSARWEGERPPMPPDLVALFDRTAADLEAELRATAPSEHVWTWHEPDQTAGFWQRRMAHETAIHRWDAQLAHDTPAPIEAELAADGVDETFDVLLWRRRRGATALPAGSGETYHFHRTDGPGEWLVRFAADGPVVTREHATAGVTVRGSAGDLMLFLWHRIPADGLEVSGDGTLLPRYFELVPPN